MADTKKLQVAIEDYYNANLTKNSAQSQERKALQAAEKHYSGLNAPFELVVSETLTLVAGYDTVDSEEIDPRKLFESDPVAFWKLVDVPITNAKAMLGDKVVAKITRPVKKTSFKIKKVKGKVNED
jgi:hypothetical protein